MSARREMLAVMAMALVAAPTATTAEGGCHAISGSFVNQEVPCIAHQARELS